MKQKNFKLLLISVLAFLLSTVGAFSAFASNDYVQDATPSASVVGGEYQAVQTVELSTDLQDAKIYYTLNGELPTNKSLEYSEALEIGEKLKDTSVTLKAVTYKNGKYSDVLIETYSILARNNVVKGVRATFEDGVSVKKTTNGQEDATDVEINALTDGILDHVGVMAEKNTWITFDFGSEKTVNEIIVMPYKDWNPICNLRIQLATQADFSDAYCVMDIDDDSAVAANLETNGTNYRYQYYIYPRTARYIRVSNAGNDKNHVSILNDIFVFEGDEVIETTNLARGQKVEASNGSGISFGGDVDKTLFGGLKGLVNDYVRSNGYLSIDGAENYVEIELDRVYKLGQFFGVSHISWDWGGFTIQTSQTSDFANVSEFTAKTAKIVSSAEHKSNIAEFWSYECDLNGVEAKFIRVKSDRGNLFTQIKLFPYFEKPLQEGENVLKGIVPTVDSDNVLVSLEGNESGDNNKYLSQTTDGIVGNWNGVSGSANEYYTYDLGKEISLNRISAVVYPDFGWNNIYSLCIQTALNADFTEGVFDVIYSEDGQPRTANSTLDEKPAFEVAFAPRMARYIRIKNTGRNETDSSRVNEIKAFYGTEVIEDSNLAIHKNLVKDPTYNYRCGETGNAPNISQFSNVTNGDICNYGLLLDANQWFTFDLGQISTFDSVMFSAYKNWTPIGNIKIQASKTADFAEPIDLYIADTDTYVQTNYTQAEGKLGFKFDFNAVDARYVRVTNTGRTTTESARLVEFQVYACQKQAEQIVEKTLVVPSEITKNVYNVASLDDIKTSLGNQIDIFDNEGVKYTCTVEWASADFAQGTSGTYTFNGTLSGLPAGVANIYNIEATAKITVLEALNFTELNATITECDSLVKEDYTEASFSALEAQLVLANATVLNNTQLQADVDDAKTTLQLKINNLVSISALADKIVEAEAVQAEDYTVLTITALTDAIATAKTVLAKTDSTQTQVNTSVSALETAISNLQEIGDKTSLQAKYDELKDTESATYTATTFASLSDALTQAKTILDKQEASQTEIDNALTVLNEKFGLLVNLGDKTSLNEKIAEVEGLDSSKYTTETFAELTTELESAKVVAGSLDVDQAQVDTALTALQGKIDALVALVDKSSLQELLGAEKQAQGEYSVLSYTVYSTAYDTAKEVFDNAEATQTEVDSACDALTDAVDQLTVEENDETSVARTGCTSSISGSFAIMIMLTLLGMIIIKRKNYEHN